MTYADEHYRLGLLNLLRALAQVADGCEAMDERTTAPLTVSVHFLREARDLLAWYETQRSKEEK